MWEILSPLGILLTIFKPTYRHLKIKLCFCQKYIKTKKIYKEKRSLILIKHLFIFIWVLALSFIAIFFFIVRVLNDKKIDIVVIFNFITSYLCASLIHVIDILDYIYLKGPCVSIKLLYIPFVVVFLILISILFNGFFEITVCFLIYYRKYLILYYNYREKDCNNTLIFIVCFACLASNFLPTEFVEV